MDKVSAELVIVELRTLLEASNYQLALARALNVAFQNAAIATEGIHAKELAEALASKEVDESVAE